MRLLGQLALLFGDLPMVLGVRDHVLEADLLLAQPLARALDQRFGQAELSGNLKGIGLAGHADGEAVGGPKCLHVELHRSVLDAPRGQRERLEFGIMGGGERRRFHFEQMLQNRHRQRRALRGVGARAQFIEKGKRTGRDVFQNLHNVGHVRREGGQRLLDGLLVADVGVHLVEDGQFRAQVRGYRKACLRHQGHQPHRLHGDGLAAGIGAGDDEGGELAAHP